MSDKPIRVLLVDDEQELVDHLVKRLRQRNFEVLGLDRGEKALAVARDRTFDVAVVDMKMPGLDGLEVLKALKSLQERIQVIMFTGYGSDDSRFKAREFNAYGFFAKPYDFDKLVREIRRAANDRRSTLRRAFQDELDKRVDAGLSPAEAERETERLRVKYEQ